MTRALYIKRKDGNYDFVAAFAIDEARWDEDVAETFAENLRQEGEEVLIIHNCALNKLSNVFSPTANGQKSLPVLSLKN